MRHSIFLAATIALMAPAAAMVQPESGPTRLTITLSSFAFEPQVITLRHGAAYVLHLDNQSGGGHNFAAPEFFAAAQVAPADRAKIDRGRVEVAGGSSVDIHLTAPAAGSYELRCTHFLHTGFGMRGSIIVE